MKLSNKEVVEIAVKNNLVYIDKDNNVICNFPNMDTCYELQAFALELIQSNEEKTHEVATS